MTAGVALTGAQTRAGGRRRALSRRVNRDVKPEDIVLHDGRPLVATWRTRTAQPNITPHRKRSSDEQQREAPPRPVALRVDADPVGYRITRPRRGRRAADVPR